MKLSILAIALLALGASAQDEGVDSEPNLFLDQAAAPQPEPELAVAEAELVIIAGYIPPPGLQGGRGGGRGEGRGGGRGGGRGLRK